MLSDSVGCEHSLQKSLQSAWFILVWGNWSPGLEEVWKVLLECPLEANHFKAPFLITSACPIWQENKRKRNASCHVGIPWSNLTMPITLKHVGWHQEFSVIFLRFVCCHIAHTLPKHALLALLALLALGLSFLRLWLSFSYQLLGRTRSRLSLHALPASIICLSFFRDLIFVKPVTN